MPRAIALFLLLCACLLLAADPPARDWPMWGGTPERNMVSAMPGAPVSWDVKTKANVKWVAQLGSQTYGNPVVAGGQVYIGTNNASERNKQEPGDRGALMCFRESDGQFLWQHTSENLGSPAVDWPEIGVCSSPLVEEDRLYYVTNRGELLSLDTHGDGKGASRVVWSFEMRKETGAMPLNMSNSSPVSFGDLLFVSTSNGRDDKENVPAPRAPSLIAVNKKTGKLAWQANSVGDKILAGQWSSPAAGTIGGTAQVVIGEGDGWVRSYEAPTGKKLWEFDTNPKNAVWPKTRNYILSTAVIWQDRVYIANGQDPEAGSGPGHLYAIDAAKRGDITATGMIWHYDKIRRSISTVAITGGLLFAADLTGYLHCLDVATGAPFWTHDMLAAVWGSPIVIGGTVYLGDEDGDIAVLEAAKTKKLLGEIGMGSNVYSTPVPAGGTLFIANRTHLFAIGPK
jgi:outer membrane protein assembly factor BamB